MKKALLTSILSSTFAFLAFCPEAHSAVRYTGTGSGFNSSFSVTPAFFSSQPVLRYIRRSAPLMSAMHDSRVSPRLLAAAKIAEQSAHRRSQLRCWRYVKKALLSAGAVSSYPGTNYAKQAGGELTRKYGFKRLRVSNPYKAPVGSVLVYGGRGAGHVELRTARGFASDYRSPYPAALPFLGAYIKSV